MSHSKPGLFAQEPIFIGHLVSAGLGYAAVLAVSRGWITHTHASSLTQQVAPMATSALLTLQGAFLRRFVSPATRQRAVRTASDLESVVLHIEKSAEPIA